jgi:5-(carboxyamino)imidazole ribonucleotide mutase
MRVRAGYPVPVMGSTSEPARVGIVMGSRSDWEVLRHASETLEALAVPHERRVVSAHRTPDRLYEYATRAADRGLRVIVAGAGGAAHLPGMLASLSPLPVLGVPVPTRHLGGLESLLSIVQMPGGVPVGTLAIGRAGAVNAALLAVSILALEDEALAGRWRAWRAEQRHRVLRDDDPSRPPQDGPGARPPQDAAAPRAAQEAP